MIAVAGMSVKFYLARKEAAGLTVTQVWYCDTNTARTVFIKHFYITDQVLRLAHRLKTFSRSVLQPCNRRQFKFYLSSQF